MLAILNRHTRDTRISFEEIEHKYTIDGDSVNFTSTTTFIKKFFSEFDADGILGKMVRFGTFKKKYGDKTPDEVKLEWKQCGAEAAQRGTRLHKYIEDFYNAQETAREQVADLDKEVGYFYNFLKSTQLTPYRTEWYIFDERSKIAGSIDMVFQVDPAGAPHKVAIYDWKCSKEIKVANRYEKGKSPVAHLDNCNFNHYSLQLNMYKYIIEKYYGLEVVDMNLVVIHKNHVDFFLVNIKDMQKEIVSMLDVRARRS